MEAERPLNVSNDVRVGEYWLKSKVGENCLCIVWKAEHVLSGEVVAVKQIYLYKLNKHLKTCLDCELNFLSSVNHPNIIRLFNVFQNVKAVFDVAIKAVLQPPKPKQQKKNIEDLLCSLIDF
ncbi:hypothetical protein LWI29_003536 [Acer saccharum]|uniref:Protein kinase domain-containing protein n=1 Tax=Acer saccharum TaxID=4024 RepID=A0AA39TB36_ACESA|nr:hypothetical protein LWI29_003536 [Acer saccharum]